MFTCFVRIRFIVVCLGISAVCRAADDGAPAPIRYGKPRQLATLENDKISESSGLAVSRRYRDIFWTHNDSGDTARIFAFDKSGRQRGECRIAGAKAVDWEDIASFKLSGKPYLLIADTGDNARTRESCELYLIDEPDLGNRTVPLVQTIRFRYADGPHDCEAVAVDTARRQILLVTKVAGLQCQLFELPLPRTQLRETLVAKEIAKPPVTLATAMDISLDGRRAIVLSHFGFAQEFTRAGDEPWSTTMNRPGRRIELPKRKQGESICFGADGQTIYLTSELTPTPLWEVPVEEK